MNEPGVVRKFFTVVFAIMFVCLLIALIATLLGFGDLDAGKLGIGCLITAIIFGRLSKS